ncbi:MAG: hypothetical protein IJ620_00855 [Bacteroidales bacterium]|nr:hypothetical protein [Bacteroidales bacterium]
MKRRCLLTLVVLMLTGLTHTQAQVHLQPLFSDLDMEARAEFDYNNLNRSPDQDDNTYGMSGRYFNLRVGGSLSEQFSYYLRQRIIATPGSSTMFDNTDFLYLNYKISPNWSLRAGKDALMVGGHEYDAAPIDVYFNTYSWDMFYCFQLAASAAYTFNDGNHSIAFQVANSPYVFSLASQPATLGGEADKSLLSYNLFWSGKFGHLHMLYSANLFERERGYFMNYIALGHKVTFDSWDLYIDLMHHSLGTDDWGKIFGIVGCANLRVTPWLNLFAKGGYETNHSKYEIDYASFASTTAPMQSHDILAQPETDSYFYGMGVEITPVFCKDVRLHALANQYHHTHPDLANPGANTTESKLNVKVGLTWFMNIHRMARERKLFSNNNE